MPNYSGIWTLSQQFQAVGQGNWPLPPPPPETFAVFALGNTGGSHSTTRNRYTYAGDVVSAGGAATAASYFGSAAGNSTTGIFALGNTSGGGRSTTRDRYTYAGCVVSAGGSALGYTPS